MKYIEPTEPVVITTKREKYRKGVLMTHKKKRDQEPALEDECGLQPRRQVTRLQSQVTRLPF